MDFQQVFNQTHQTSNYIIKTNNYTQDTISIDMQIGLDIIYARNKEKKKKKKGEPSNSNHYYPPRHVQVSTIFPAHS